jgi:hypothetical protein
MSDRLRVMLTWFGILNLTIGLTVAPARAGEDRMPLEFSGGHQIGDNDFGRPVVLIAAALGVKPEEFRDAFSGVTPAKGRGPSREEARRNKGALMKVLGPLGVTNERLDAVSDYYRYQPQKGELWTTVPATGYAVVEDGKVKKVVITQPGSGYSSSPKVTIRGKDSVSLKASLSFDKDLKRNGAVRSVELVADPRGDR